MSSPQRDRLRDNRPHDGHDENVHEWGALRDQVIGTAILLFVLVAIVDTRNTAPGANLAPVVMGLLVVAIGLSWGTLRRADRTRPRYRRRDTHG